MSNINITFRKKNGHFSGISVSQLHLVLPRLFILYQAPNSGALAPACHALVVSSSVLEQGIFLRTKYATKKQMNKCMAEI